MGKPFKTVLIIFVGIAFLLFLFFTFSSDENATVMKEEIPYVEIDEATSNEISMAHHLMNNLVGWGGIYRFYKKDVFDSYQNEMESILTRIDNAKKTCQNEVVLRDLIRAEKALKKGIQNRDYRGLRYAHRILHDVNFITTYHEEAFTFQDHDLRLWHVSETGGGNYSKIERYIN